MKYSRWTRVVIFSTKFSISRLQADTSSCWILQCWLPTTNFFTSKQIVWQSCFRVHFKMINTANILLCFEGWETFCNFYISKFPDTYIKKKTRKIMSIFSKREKEKTWKNSHETLSNECPWSGYYNFSIGYDNLLFQQRLSSCGFFLVWKVQSPT